jgi:chromosome segregation ATPase
MASEGPPKPAQAEESAKIVIEAAQMEVDDTDRVVAELRATVDRLRAEASNLAGARDQQQAEIDQVRAALVAAQVLQTDTAAKLQTELHSRQASAAGTEARIVQMQQQISNLTDQAQTLNDEKLKLEEQAAQFIANQAAKDQRIAQLERVEQNVVLYRKQKDAAEAERTQFRVQVRQLELQVAQLTQQKLEAAAEIKRLNDIMKKRKELFYPKDAIEQQNMTDHSPDETAPPGTRPRRG